MGVKSKIVKAAATTALGMGLSAVTPFTVFAAGPLDLGTIHGNGHTKVNSQLKDSVRSSSDVLTQDAGQTIIGLTSGKQSSSDVNAIVNTHVNAHENIHVNLHSNSHAGASSKAHVNAHENIHVSLHANQAAQLSQVAANLESSLQALGCDNVDYLYAYLQSVHLTDTDLVHIQGDIDQMNHLVVGTHGKSGLSTVEVHEGWRLLIHCMNAAHLQVAFVDQDNHPVDVFTSPSTATVHVQLKDNHAHTLATFKSPGHPSTQVFTHDVKTVAKAANSAHALSKTGNFVPAPRGQLPETATPDPILIVFGLLLAIIGACTLIPAVRLEKRGK